MARQRQPRKRIAAVSTFPADFRRIVAPRLQQAARLQGLFVVTGSQGFGEAVATVMALAYRLGAAHLPAAIRTELDDAVCEWVLAAVDEVLPAWEAAERLAARVAEDIARHEARSASIHGPSTCQPDA